MKLNSQQALDVGRRLYESHGRDWSKVRDAGQVRRDGVIDVRPESKPASPPPPTDRRAN